MFTIDLTRPHMVTGATGYVAGWLVKRLLDAGATVHAPVRDPDNGEKTDHLRRVADASPGTLRFFRADLLDEGSYAAAMAGCGVVFHTASPFSTHVGDPQRDLVDPAVAGTRNVLEEANRTETVTRVVLTSSCAAIYGDNADIAAAPGGRLVESVWNTTSSLQHNPYSYSKTLAERTAWEIAGAQARWRLVVVNPCLVIGPALQDRPTSESFNILRQLGDGTMRAGAPRWGIGTVDVRDLATAHLAAAFLPDAEGRHIICAEATDFVEIARALRPRFGDRYPLPARALPKWLLWLAGPLVSKGLTRAAVAGNVNVPFRADNSHGKAALGLDYRPLQTSLEEMFQQMIDSGQLPKR